MTKEARFKQIASQMTARERIVARLEAYRAGRAPDPQIGLRRPPEQDDEFYAYSQRLAAAHRVSPQVAVAVAGAVAEAGALAGWLGMFTLMEVVLDPVWAYLLLASREPITESAYQKQVRAARAERLSLTDCAELLASDEADATGTDPTEKEERSWVARKRRALRGAIQSGALVAKRRGTGFTVTLGAFDDWCGVETTVGPERGIGYAPRPDAEAETVAGERALRADVWRAIDTAREILRSDCIDGGDALAASLRPVVEARFHGSLTQAWRHLRALEEPLAALAGELGCADVCMPDVRESLDASRQTLERLAAPVPGRPDPIALPNPTPEDQALLAELLDRA